MFHAKIGRGFIITVLASKKLCQFPLLPKMKFQCSSQGILFQCPCSDNPGKKRPIQLNPLKPKSELKSSIAIYSFFVSYEKEPCFKTYFKALYGMIFVFFEDFISHVIYFIAVHIFLIKWTTSPFWELKLYNIVRTIF